MNAAAASGNGAASVPLDGLLRLAISIGNTHTQFGSSRDGAFVDRATVATADLVANAALVNEFSSTWEQTQFDRIAIASVVPAATAVLRAFLERRHDVPCGVVGRDIPVPLPLDVDEPETVGIDRICAAAAAFARTRAACVVVDFGTAATVNAVADNGVFIGGAILPGLGLAARALNEHTAALPLVDTSGPVQLLGRDTRQAIRTGIVTGLRGAVRELVESMAESFGKWPKLLFTGGDAARMGEVCDFVDAVVPDLGLLGVDLADRLYLLQTDACDE